MQLRPGGIGLARTSWRFASYNESHFLRLISDLGVQTRADM